MQEIKNVRGSQENIEEIEVNVDTVYVRKNIKEVNEGRFKGWEYDETQYSIQEWIKLMSSEQKALSDALAELVLGGVV